MIINKSLNKTSSFVSGILQLLLLLYFSFLCFIVSAGRQLFLNSLSLCRQVRAYYGHWHSLWWCWCQHFGSTVTVSVKGVWLRVNSGKCHFLLVVIIYLWYLPEYLLSSVLIESHDLASLVNQDNNGLMVKPFLDFFPLLHIVICPNPGHSVERMWTAFSCHYT